MKIIYKLIFDGKNMVQHIKFFNLKKMFTNKKYSEQINFQIIYMSFKYIFLFRECWWSSILQLTVLSVHLRSAGGFSLGAPTAACSADMKPRHGFAPQVKKQVLMLVPLKVLNIWFDLYGQC